MTDVPERARGLIIAPNATNPVIDPLRRVFVPKEAKTAAGTTVFRTRDSEVYARLDDGSIRRAHPKVNGKIARKARAKLRSLPTARLLRREI